MKSFLKKDLFTRKYLVDNRERLLKVGIIFVIILTALVVFFLKGGSEDEKIQDVSIDKIEKREKKQKSEELILVDIGGGVNNPIVVELKKGSRVRDAIEAADGLRKDADISNVNRAAIVNDGEKIHIPVQRGEGAGDSLENTQPTKVSINSGTSAQLQSVHGIGAVTAEKIIRYRSTNGNFNKLEDLKKIEGIGEKTFEKIKQYLIL